MLRRRRVSRHLFRTSPFLDHIEPFFFRELEGGAFPTRLRALPIHSNAKRTVHGGVLITLCDIALGYRTNRSQTWATLLRTASVATDFAGTAKVGDWLKAYVDVHKLGCKLAVANCYIVRGEERIAHASAVFSRINPSGP